MKKKKIILPKLRYENAPELDSQIRVELEEDRTLLKNNDRDIVIDLAEQFASERSSSLRYKLYGKMKMIFRNLYCGASQYDYLRERLSLAGDGSDGNFAGFLPYNEFAFLRDDIYYELPQPQTVDVLSGVTPFNLVMNGSTEHQTITALLAPQFNWGMYLTYVHSHDINFPMKYTLTGDTIPVLSFLSGDGIPFRVQEEINKYVLTSPVKHGMNQGEYILIDGRYYYINSIGNEIYRSDEYVINILKSQVRNVTFNTLVTGKRCIDIKDPENATSEYYVHKHRTLTSIDDYVIDKVGFETPIWEDEQKRLYENSSGDNDVLVVRNKMEAVLFDFKEPFVLSGITNNLGYTPTDLYISMIFRNGNGYFNYPPKVGYSFHMHDSWIDEHFDGDDVIEPNLTYTTFQRDGITFMQGNEIPNGTELYGAFVEYNPKEMKERIISEAFHKIISNPLIFNHAQTSNDIYHGASETNPIGLLYQPHYRYKIRELSPYIESSDISVPIENLPENAVYFPNEKIWRWRDLYDDGYIDPDGYGTDYPYLNDIHYIHKNINFYLRNEVIYTNKKDAVINFYKSTELEICDTNSLSYLRAGVAPTPPSPPSPTETITPPFPTQTPTASYVPVGNIYLSPYGDDNNGDGTSENPWYSLNKAWENVESGDLIYMMGGTYEYDERQYLSGKNGDIGNTIKLYAYPGQTPIITRSDNFTQPSSWPFGFIVVEGDYIHVKGLEVAYYTQLTSNVWEGLRAYGCNHCVFELLNIHHCGMGMQLTNCDDCSVLNSDFHHNQDPLTSYSDGDGFGVDCTNATTNRTNTIDGCRFWWNSDDGLDAWGEESTVIIQNCWSFWNGYIPDTFTLAGDGNGFKLGNTEISNPSVILRQLYNNLSFENRRWGFLDNDTLCNMVLYNNVAYNNGNVDTNPSWKGGFYFNIHPEIPYYIKNNISFANGNTQAVIGNTTNVEHNTWDSSVIVTNTDFITISSSGVDGDREDDGNLPILDFLKLSSTSDLRYAGTYTGILRDCAGNLWNNPPSIGAYELVPVSPTPSRTPSITPSRTPSRTVSRTPSRTPSLPPIQASPLATPSRSVSQSPVGALHTYYVATNGSDSNAGTFISPWRTLNYAWSRAVAGDLIYVRGGTYTYSMMGITTLSNKDGTANNMIKIWNYPDEKPIIDFRGYSSTGGQNIIRLQRADYIHIKGLHIRNLVQQAGGTTHVGFRIAEDCNYCIIENCEIDHIGGWGVTLYGGSNTAGTASSNNLILNCDSHHNSDRYSTNNPWGGSDGFLCNSYNGTAYPSMNNTFRGCRSYWNSDDGWDFLYSDAQVILENCWSFWNGYRPGIYSGDADSWTVGGNGVGIKLGYKMSSPDIATTRRKITNCLVFENSEIGIQHYVFDADEFEFRCEIYNNTCYNNGSGGNFNFGSQTLARNIIINNLSYRGSNFVNAQNDARYNSWNSPPGVSLSDSDFVSLNSAGIDGPRDGNGNLPYVNFLRLASTSDCINAGIDIGLPYSGTAPDLGAFEYGSGAPASSPTRTPSRTPSRSAPAATPTRTPSRTPSRSVPSASGSQIIADHTIARYSNLTNIPTYYIDRAKTNLLIAYNHTSHGSQILDGMTGLVSSAMGGTTYRWTDSTTHTSGYLSIDNNGINGWWDLGYADDYDAWETSTRSYLNSHPNCNVVMWSWCGELSYLSSTTVQTYYLNGMARLESEFPSVKFVYMTGHLDGTGSSGTLHLRNEQIRSHVRANSNRVLFDFADIERYNPDNVDYLNRQGDDGCNYDNDTRNWATEWQSTHTLNVQWYNCTCAHSQPLNGNLKTYAAWYLWARLAGWNG